MEVVLISARRPLTTDVRLADRFGFIKQPNANVRFPLAAREEFA